MPFERSLLAAQGYLELDMISEALAELDALPAEFQEQEEVLQLKLFIFMRDRQWERALELCERMCMIFPKSTVGYIHGAFCLHELGKTAEAKSFLLKGPPNLAKEATYFYNLGCYDAVLGNREEATRNLHKSFQMDKKFRDIAKYDPDLKDIADFL